MGGSFEDSRVNLCSRGQCGFSVQDLVVCSSCRRQAVQNGNYSGQVTGTIYATGFGNVTQVVAVRGTIHSDGPTPIEIPFEAHLAIDGSWNGTGGFSYGNVHVENVPVVAKK